MKAAQRKRWIELAVNATKAAEVEATDLHGELMPCFFLCGFCRYGAWEGGSCADSYPTCSHPIEFLQYWQGDSVWPDAPDGDCWGFNPKKGGFEQQALEAFNFRRVEVVEEG